MTVRILVTNDDGYDSAGIRALARAAADRGHDVLVAAPMSEASGMSAALTAVTDGGRIIFERRDRDGIPGYAVAASPAYIVVLAGLGVFGPPPDIVLSGINRGANAGRSVLHSGTVGAALTAANAGYRALAVSLDIINDDLRVPPDEDLNWAAAAGFAGELLGTLAGEAPGTVLNLNVPDRPSAAGLRTARLAGFGQTRLAVADTGDGYVRTTVELEGADHEPGTDIAWLAAGYATVTALRPPAEAAVIHLPAQRTPEAPAPR